MQELAADKKPALRRLQIQWGFIFILAACLWLGDCFLLAIVWSKAGAIRWLALSLPAFVYVLWWLWRNLSLNCRPGETELLPVFGAGNTVSILRGLMIAMLAGFLFSPRPDGWQAWIPGVLYSIAVLIDFLDGYLARVTHHVTRLGEALDITLDGLGVLTATLLIVQYGQAPWWYILVGGARYIYLAALWLLQRSGKPRFDAPPNSLRRGLAGLQMGFIFMALWPVFSPPGTHLAAIAFGIPFLAHFIFDWLVVSGRLTESMLRRRYSLVPLVVNWLPVGLRACVVVYVLAVIRSAGLIQDVWVFLEMGAALLIIFGAAGRIAAILGLAALGLQQDQALLPGVQQGMIFVYTAVLIIGTGALSAWKPETVLYSQHAGERTQ